MSSELLWKKTWAFFVIGLFAISLFAPVAYAVEASPSPVIASPKPTVRKYGPSDFSGLMGDIAKQIRAIPASKGVTEAEKQDAYRTLEAFRVEQYEEFFTYDATSRLSSEGALIANSLGSDVAELNGQTLFSASSSIVTKGSADIPPELLNYWRAGIRGILRCMVAGQPFGPEGVTAACASGKKMPIESLSTLQERTQTNYNYPSAGSALDYDKLNDLTEGNRWKDAAVFAYKTQPVVRVLLEEYEKGDLYEEHEFANALLAQIDDFEKNQQYGLAFYTSSVSLTGRYLGDDEHGRFLSFLTSMPVEAREGYKLVSACLEEGHTLGELNSLYLNPIQIPLNQEGIEKEVTARVGRSSMGGYSPNRETVRNQVIAEQEALVKKQLQAPAFSKFACLKESLTNYQLVGLTVNRDSFLLKLYRTPDPELKTLKQVAAFLDDIEAAKMLADKTANELLAQKQLAPGATRSATILLADARGKKLIKDHPAAFEAAKPGFAKRALKALPDCLKGAVEGFTSPLNLVVLGIYVGISGFTKLGFPPSTFVTLGIDGAVITALTASTAISAYEVNTHWDEMNQNKKDVAVCGVASSAVLLVLPVKSSLKKLKESRFPKEPPKVDAGKLPKDPLETISKSENQPRVTLPTAKQTASAVWDFVKDMAAYAEAVLIPRIRGGPEFAYASGVPNGFGRPSAIAFGDFFNQRYNILKARLRPKISDSLPNRLFMSAEHGSAGGGGSSGGGSGGSGSSGGGGGSMTGWQYLAGGAAAVWFLWAGRQILSDYGHVFYHNGLFGTGEGLELFRTAKVVVFSFLVAYGGLWPLIRRYTWDPVSTRLSQPLRRGGATAAEDAAQAHPPAEGGAPAVEAVDLTLDPYYTEAVGVLQTEFSRTPAAIPHIVPFVRSLILRYVREATTFVYTPNYFNNIAARIRAEMVRAAQTGDDASFSAASLRILNAERFNAGLPRIESPAQAAPGAAPQAPAGGPAPGNAGPAPAGGRPAPPAPASAGPEAYRYVGNFFTRFLGPKLLPELAGSTAPRITGPTTGSRFRPYRSVIEFLIDQQEIINTGVGRTNLRITNPGRNLIAIRRYLDARNRFIIIAAMGGISAWLVKWAFFDNSPTPGTRPVDPDDQQSPSPGNPFDNAPPEGSQTPVEAGTPEGSGTPGREPPATSPSGSFDDTGSLDNWGQYELVAAYSGYVSARDEFYATAANTRFIAGTGLTKEKAASLKTDLDAAVAEAREFDAAVTPLGA